MNQTEAMDHFLPTETLNYTQEDIHSIYNERKINFCIYLWRKFVKNYKKYNKHFWYVMFEKYILSLFSTIASLIIFLISSYCKTIFKPIYFLEYVIILTLFIANFLEIFLEIADSAFFEKIIFRLIILLCVTFLINWIVSSILEIRRISKIIQCKKLRRICIFII
jgi:hypothetical protein